MSETNIEVLEMEKVIADNPIVALPVNFVSVGTVEHDSVQVYIKQDVYKRIEKFAKEEMSKEVGSILIGDYVDEKDRKTVVISNYIEAKYTDASASTLTFTHETWDYVYKEKDKKYPDKKIVGWQHTHPGYGIFLSNYDIFIQENFFNLPWQIAYVVDPIADTRGFFEWKNDKIAKMSGFYVYDEIGKEIKVSEKNKPVKKHFSVTTFVLSFLLLVSLLVSVSFEIEKNNVMGRLNEVLATINRQSNIPMNETPSVVEQELPEDIEAFKVYVVQEGDYLEGICKQYDLDYMSNIQKIMRINSIMDVNKIYVGQKLYLPIEK